MELSAAYKLHEGGKARILAVTTDKRLELLPNIPTMIEAGVPNFISDTWNAISAPPKTPAPIIAKLNRTINEIIGEPETKARFKELNLIAGGRHPCRHGQAEERRDRALDQGDPRRGNSAGVGHATPRAHAMISGVSWSSMKEMRSRR